MECDQGCRDSWSLTAIAGYSPDQSWRGQSAILRAPGARLGDQMIGYKVALEIFVAAPNGRLNIEGDKSDYRHTSMGAKVFDHGQQDDLPDHIGDIAIKRGLGSRLYPDLVLTRYQGSWITVGNKISDGWDIVGINLERCPLAGFRGWIMI